MLEKFSLDAQKIISSAESLSFDLSHPSIGLEHLLLAILKIPDNTISVELKKYKLTFKTVLSEIKGLFQNKMGEVFYMEYTLELRNTLDSAITLSKEYKEEKVSVNCLCISLMKNMQGICLDILNKYKINRNEILYILISNQKKVSELDRVIDLHDLSYVKKDPLIGRNKELFRLITALKRRNKPNALLIGEPGIGKTAIVEELAALLKKSSVKGLENKTIYELDMASVVGGTKYRGEFEEKLKKIIKMVKEDGNAILFIDEIHNIIKAGGAEGAIDASNILKPYLSRGEIQIIGATTTDEYYKTIAKDKALNRRFQIIKIDPSTEGETIDILKNLSPLYEKYYMVNINDSIIEFIVDLAHKYLPGLAFPDKALDILDNACVTYSGTRISKESIKETMLRFYNIKVDDCCKAKVVETNLKNSLFGQDAAIDLICNNLLRVEKGFYDKNKPILTMFFVGPSGVGKTEAAKIISRDFLLNQEGFIKLDMALYQENASMNKLIGSPPGYSGYEEKTSFVKRLKDHPNALVLIDEIEKAHIDVIDFFLNVFDEGYFYDAHNERIDCKNAIFIMTSNLGYSFEKKYNSNYSLAINEQGKDDIYKELSKHFRLEFLNRIDEIVAFHYLDEKCVTELSKKFIKEFNNACNQEQATLIDETDLHIDNMQLRRFGARYIKREILKKLTEKSSSKENTDEKAKNLN